MKHTHTTNLISPHRNIRDRIALFIIFYNFCANLSNDIYLPSLPTLMEVFNTTPNMTQLTMAAWYAGVALPQLIFGPLSDSFGRRPILFGGGLCFLLGSLACAFAPNITILILARFIQGIGVSSLNVSSFAILADLYQSEKRIKIITKIGVVGTLAPLIGPVIGGYMLVYAGWRSNFLIIFLMALFCLLGLWQTCSESNSYLDRAPLSIKNIYKNYLSLLKENGFLKHLIPYCLILSCIVAYLTAAPFIIINQLQIDPRYFGYTQFSVFSAYIIGAIILGKQKNSETIKKFLWMGMKIILLSSFMMLILSHLFQDHLFILIIPMTIFTFGSSLCGSPLISEVISSQMTSGLRAAFLGFGMAVSCMLSSSLVGLFYTGAISSLANLIFLLTTIAAVIYQGVKSTHFVFAKDSAAKV